jgi:hypothetical protein
MNNINYLIMELNKEVTPKGRTLLIELVDLILLELENASECLKSKENENE